MKNSNATVAEWIASAIADTGCKVVYGGHGGAVVPLVNAIVDHPDLKWVYARNEHDAATMAAAHAKLTGTLGVVVATSGPGATNLTTGLMEAVLDELPLLAITGLKPTAVMGHFEFQDVNQSQLFVGAGVPWSKDAASASGVVPLLRDAISTAVVHNTCAHLAVPEDIQAMPSTLPIRKNCVFNIQLHLAPAPVNLGQVQEAAKTMVGRSGKERNVIAVGLRALASDGSYTPQQLSDAVLHLAESLRAPVLTRLDAKGLVDETHPLSFGVIGVHGKPGLETAASLISTSERIICIGVQDEMLLLCNKAGVQVRNLIEIQNSAAHLKARYQAEHQVLGDIVGLCQALSEEVQKLQMSSTDGTPHSTTIEKDQFDYMLYQQTSHELHSKLLEEPKSSQLLVEEALGVWNTMHTTDWKEESKKGRCYEVVHPTADIAPDGSCHPATVLQAYSDLRQDLSMDESSRSATVCVDVGDITLWASLCLTLEAGSRTMYSERLGTMGYGLNAGVASILAKKPVASAVVLVGDGSFQMTLQELATFQEHKRPGDRLLCIVFDNANLARVEFGFAGAKGTSVEGPDYVALAKAYGGDGVLVSNNDARTIKALLREVMHEEGLYLIHVKVDRNIKADMANFQLSPSPLQL